MMWFWSGVALVVALLAYVRLAPTNTKAVHCAIDRTEDADSKGRCVRVLDAGPDDLARLDQAMRALPRTQCVAGSVDEGRITYVTRSKWVGFPDYTTLEQSDGQIKMFGRLRFGLSDFGVNRARLGHLIKCLGA